MFVASPHCNAVEVSLWTLTELFWNCLANVFSLIIAQELVGLQWCLNSPELNTSKLASSSFEETLRRVFTILQNREQNAFGGHNNIIYQVQQNRDAAPRTRSVWPGLNTGILCKRRMQAPSVVVTATNCNPLLLFFLKPFTHEKDWTTFRTRSHKCTKSGGGGIATTLITETVTTHTSRSSPVSYDKNVSLSFQTNGYCWWCCWDLPKGWSWKMRRLCTEPLWRKTIRCICAPISHKNRRQS